MRFVLGSVRKFLEGAEANKIAAIKEAPTPRGTATPEGADAEGGDFIRFPKGWGSFASKALSPLSVRSGATEPQRLRAPRRKNSQRRPRGISGQSLALLLGSMLSSRARAGEAAIYRGQRLGRLYRAGQEMETRFPQIQGSWDHFYPGPAGITCASGALVKVAWKADVQKAYIRLDEHGASVFEIQLGPVDLRPEGYLRDGWVCQWGGSLGRARVTDVAVNFVLSPQDDSPYPKVTFGNLTFQGLQFFDFQVGLRDGWQVGGEVDPWFRQWIEQNLNQLLQNFLASPLKKHLDSFLTAELEKMLKDREREAETGQIMRTRRIPFSNVPFPDDFILLPPAP